MDSLANYGSDDEYEESGSEKMGSGPGGSRTRTPEADVNYDEVQMDLSEESNNNNSTEDDDQSRSDKPQDKKRPHEGSSSRAPARHKRHHEDTHRRKHESRKHDSGSRRDDKRRHRKSGSRERTSRTEGSKERRRSRSPRRGNDHRRRSNSKEREPRGRYGKKFDRTSNKIAQLEKLGIEIKTPDSEFVTPQMLLQRSMDEQVQKVKSTTGIELPKYYNPAAMNPARYADQIQKRRLLWQKKGPVEPTAKPQVWEQTTFAQDSDGKVASKFKRLMGIKKENPAEGGVGGGKDILKKQEEMFSSMEQQYEVARTATHTMRGVGLGFGTYNSYPR